jgi:hypothetical protein
MGAFEKLKACGAKIVPPTEEQLQAVREGKDIKDVKVDFKAERVKKLIELDSGVTDEEGFAKAVADLNKQNAMGF